MGRNILKNTGKIILAAIFVFFSIGLYASEIETELTPSQIAVGDSAVLKLKITGKSSKVTPVKFPAIDGLQITFSGSSRSFQFVNGKSWSGTVLSFTITGMKKGEYKIPSFILETDGEKIASREVSLSVKELTTRGSGNSGPMRGDIELSSESVYIGEPLVMRYIINNTGDEFPHVDGFSEQPHVKGFVKKEIDSRSDIGDKIYAGYYCLVPVDKGSHDIGGGSAVVTIDRSRGFFSFPERGQIVFPYKRVNVLPLPAGGKPDNFTGDVGEFKIEAAAPSGNFKIFDEIKIPVKITGRGNFVTLSKPQIENTEGIKTVIEEKEQSLSVNGKDLTGTKNFLVTIIPQKAGKINPGRIFLVYFNPYKNIYEKAGSGPMMFEVQQGGKSGEEGEVQFASDGTKVNNFNYLYVVLIVTLIVLLIIILVLWERKKLMMIRSGMGVDRRDEVVTHVAGKSDEILKNISTAVEEKNSEMFLYNVERGLNLIDSSKLSAADQAILGEIKDKIYYCRYGGGVLDGPEMDKLSNWICSILK